MDYSPLSDQKAALDRLLSHIYEARSVQETILHFAAHPSAEGILAFDREQPVAFLLLQRAGSSADIIDIGTDRRFRRRGIALATLQHYIAHMAVSGPETIFLEVAIDNLPAFQLYKRAGFVEIGRRIGYYQRRMDNGRVEKVDALQLRYG